MARSTRRTFLKAAGALAVPAICAGRVSTADRIRLGFIGCGGRGRRLMRIFLQDPEVSVAAVSDVIEPRMDAAAKVPAEHDRAPPPDRELHHERLLERRDIDAVVVATTQHWHGLPFIQACQAGKHVYVEKPLSLTVKEGRAMVEAVRKHPVVAVMGTQQRGGAHWKKATELIRSGRLGRVPLVECWNHRNEGARAGRHPDGDPPQGYHWDRWLGPAPEVPFNPSRLRNAWWFDYSGGILTNWAVHHIDSILWAMDPEGTGCLSPTSAVCTGGKFVIDDLADTPDTIEATWEFPGWILQYRYRGYNNFRPFLSRPKSHGLCFHGTKATMYLDRDGFEVWEDRQFDSWNENPDRPVEKVENRLELPEGVGNESDGAWQREFLTSLREGRKSPLDLEASHRATLCCHLANISHFTGRTVRWDGEREEIVGDPEASKWLDRPRRSGFELPRL